MVAQLLYRRHASLVKGLVLCATARNVLGSPAERLAALSLPVTAAAIRWNPPLHQVSAEVLGMEFTDDGEAVLVATASVGSGRGCRAQARRSRRG